MMNGLQAVENWREYFGTPRGATLGIFNAAYPLGGIVGVFFVSPVADGWGRRAGLGLGAVVSIVGAILQGAAQNMPMFVISRLIIGAGSVIVAGTGAPWITEIAHPSHRATATALFLTFYSLGSITAGWTVSLCTHTIWWKGDRVLTRRPSVDFWHVPHRRRCFLAHPFRPSSTSQRHPTHFSHVRARVTPLACEQEPKGGGARYACQVPWRG